MRTVLIGGSGFIGRALTKSLLERGHEVIVTSRHPDRLRGKWNQPGVRVVGWNGFSAEGFPRELEGSFAVVNLVGESIASRRWTSKQKQLILNSRVEATQAVVEAISKAKDPPRVLVNASAVGFYGHVAEDIVTEDSPVGRDFLAMVCSNVEQVAQKGGLRPLSPLGGGLRVCRIRTGIALSPHGGALKKLLQPFRLFLGGPLGSGQQWMPWIHIDDVTRSVCFLIEHPSAEGAFNLTAPNPLRMKEFAATLGRVLHRPSFFPVPAFALKLLLGEMAGPLLLEGQRAIPHRLQQLGYSFKFPALEEALQDLLRKE